MVSGAHVGCNLGRDPDLVYPSSRVPTEAMKENEKRNTAQMKDRVIAKKERSDLDTTIRSQALISPRSWISPRSVQKVANPGRHLTIWPGYISSEKQADYTHKEAGAT